MRVRRNIGSNLAKSLAVTIVAVTALVLPPMYGLVASQLAHASAAVYDFNDYSGGNTWEGYSEWAFSGTAKYTGDGTCGIAGNCVALNTNGAYAKLELPIGETARSVEFYINATEAGFDGALSVKEQAAGATIKTHTFDAANLAQGQYTINDLQSTTESLQFVFEKGTVGNLALDDVKLITESANVAPVAEDGILDTAEDAAAGYGTLIASDSNGDSLTYSIVDGPDHGTATTTGEGNYAYTPDANYVGSDSFTFKANDGTVDSNVATISITVSSADALLPVENTRSSKKFSTIQAGINDGDTVAGDTLRISAGNYSESLSISKSVKIVGAGQGSTTIKAPTVFANGSDLISISGAGVSVDISDLTINGVSSAYKSHSSAIHVADGAHANLSKLTVDHVRHEPASKTSVYAILVGGSSTSATANIDQVSMTDYQRGGIYVMGEGSFATLTNNTIEANPALPGLLNGISLQYGADAKIVGNTINGNSYSGTGWSGSGISIWDNATDLTEVHDNIVTGNETGFAIVTDSVEVLANVDITGVTGNDTDAVVDDYMASQYGYWPWADPDTVYYADISGYDDNQIVMHDGRALVVNYNLLQATDTTPPEVEITDAKQTSRNVVTVLDGSVSGDDLSYYYCWLTTNAVVTVEGHTYKPGQEVKLDNNTASTRDTSCNTTWAKGKTSFSGQLGSFNVTNFPDGEYTVNLVAVDKTGNKSEPAKKTVVVDRTAPAVAIVNPGNDTLHKQAVDLKATITDNHLHHYWLEIKKNGTELRIPGVTGTTYTTVGFEKNTLTTLTEEGRYKVTIAARDSAGGGSKTGNRSADVVAEFVIDKSAPEITDVTLNGETVAAGHFAPKNCDFAAEPITVSGKSIVVGATVSDPSGLAYSNYVVRSMNSSGCTNGNQTTSKALGKEVDISSLADGLYRIDVRSGDKAGNTGSKHIDILIDNTAPVLKLVGIVASSDGRVLITGTSDDSAPVVVSVAGQDYSATPDASGDWSVTTDTLDTTIQHTVTANSTDEAGNVATPVSGSTPIVKSAATDKPGGPATSDPSSGADKAAAQKRNKSSASISSLQQAATSGLALGGGDNFMFALAGGEATGTAEGEGDQGSDEVSGAEDSHVLAAEDDKTGETDADADNDGCFGFFGLCWYWWVAIVAAIAVVSYMLLRSGRDGDDLPSQN